MSSSTPCSSDDPKGDAQLKEGRIVKSQRRIKFDDEVTTLATPRKSALVEEAEKTGHKMSDNSTEAGSPEGETGNASNVDEWSHTEPEHLRPAAAPATTTTTPTIITINPDRPHPPKWKALFTKHKLQILDLVRKDDRNRDGSERLGVPDSLSGRLESRYLGEGGGRGGGGGGGGGGDGHPGRNSDTFIRSAIPYLPKSAAIVCLVINILLPGIGTVTSGLLVFFCGEVRMTAKAGGRASTFCINLAVGSMQMLTAPFLLVGWLWSLVWGIYFILLSEEKLESLKRMEEKNVKAKILSAFDPSFRTWSSN